MQQDLPPTFCLYIPGRNDYSSHVLIGATFENGAWKLTPRPQHSGEWTINRTKDYHVYWSYMSFPPLHAADGSIVTKHIGRARIGSYPNAQDLAVSHAGSVYPVYVMDKHTQIFGSKPQLRANISVTYLPAAPAPPAPAPAPALVVAPKPKPQQTVSKLQPFVARQLLELARSKHEMCPITAEEFIVGETGVMPCGHLFMKLAIEETFKKELNKCPSCRQVGAPTFV